MTISIYSLTLTIDNLSPAARTLCAFLVGRKNSDWSRMILKSVIKKLTLNHFEDMIEGMGEIQPLPTAEKESRVVGLIFSDSNLTELQYLTIFVSESKKNTPLWLKVLTNIPIIGRKIQESFLSAYGVDGKACYRMVKEGRMSEDDLNYVILLSGLYLCFKELTETKTTN